MYALILLRKGRVPPTDEVSGQHERFIDGLIRRNAILLGGKWTPSAGPYVAAYLLRCDSLDEGRAISSTDPFLLEDVYKADVVGWDLVGINPGAIDKECVLTADQLA